MSATTLRSDVRTRVRDYIYESTADLITDAQINRLINAELYSLPKKNIYLEDRYETTTIQDQRDYALPTGTQEVEKLERNDGTATFPDWNKLGGWDIYDGVLSFDYNPVGGDTIRIYIRKNFTIPTDDVTALDMEDEMIDILVWGVVVRCYRMLIGYYTRAKNFDSVSKPEGVTLSTMNNWLRDAERIYKELLKEYEEVPMPRDIDLVG